MFAAFFSTDKAAKAILDICFHLHYITMPQTQKDDPSMSSQSHLHLCGSCRGAMQRIPVKPAQYHLIPMAK
jgi:hypothetical protein